MPESADPLGKRALFWAPAERSEDDPRRAPRDEVRGKHALFSVTGPSQSPPRLRRSAANTTGRTRASEVGLSDTGTVADAANGSLGPSILRRAGGIVGHIRLDCSSCRARSEVDVFEFVMLHLPLWLWRPGKGYTRLMICPACRRRTWISASLSAWSP